MGTGVRIPPSPRFRQSRHLRSSHATLRIWSRFGSGGATRAVLTLSTHPDDSKRLIPRRHAGYPPSWWSGYDLFQAYHLIRFRPGGSRDSSSEPVNHRRECGTRSQRPSGSELFQSLCRCPRSCHLVASIVLRVCSSPTIRSDTAMMVDSCCCRIIDTPRASPRASPSYKSP